MDHKLQAYTDFYRDLTPARLSLLHGVVTDDVHFVDPFHDIHGVDALRNIFVRMFKHTKNPRFHVHSAVIDPNDADSAFIYWRFSCGIWYRDIAFDGMSRIRFAIDGRVMQHVDYWDARSQLDPQLPFLLRVLRVWMGS